MPASAAPLDDQQRASQQQAPLSEPDSSTLPDIPGGWTRTDVPVGDRHFRLLLPAAPDAFLDDPHVQQANHESDYMPYWVCLWPAAKQMAKLVLNESWPRGTPALELGSGVGLVGIAGLAAGLQVTFSDYDQTSLQVALQNARHNNVEPVAAERLDWRDPDAAESLRRFPVILGCDVLYEVPLHEPLLNVLDRFLDDSGVCWFGDPGRRAHRHFCQLASERGYSVELRDETGETRAASQGIPSAFQLVVLHRHKSHDLPGRK